MSAFPAYDARFNGVQPLPAGLSTLAPAFSSVFTAAMFAVPTATPSGVCRPNPGASTLHSTSGSTWAPASRSIFTMSSCPPWSAAIKG